MKKKTTLCIALILVFTTGTNAQFVKGFGIKMGTVAANQSWHFTSLPDLQSENRWGFTVVPFVELFDLARFSVLVEAQYTQKGFKQSLPVTTESNPEGTGEFITKRPKVDYLSIPLLAKLKLPLSGFVPYLIAGPRFDVLLSTSADGYGAVVDKFKTSEFGATVGAGVELTVLPAIGLLAEFRYNPSVTDAFSTNFVTVRNRSFDFLVGVRL